jgi:hypothetical protein
MNPADGQGVGPPRPPYHDAAQSALAQYYPGARCAFIAGSITRGQGTASSDIDMPVLFGPDFTDIHRHTVNYQGWLIEFFVHNEQAQNYFLHQDRESGARAMIHMVACGVPIGPDLSYAHERQAVAQKLLVAGPKAWDQDKIDQQRYAISGEIDDLADPRPFLEQQAIIAKLFPMMAEFTLATRRFWRGMGKPLSRRLIEADSDLAAEFEAALRAAHNGDMDKMIALGHKILAPYGGYLQAGYRHAGSDEWKNFSS